MSEELSLEWLRLSKAQTRIMLCAWGAGSIVCSGHDLNVARRLSRRGLLDFRGATDEGLQGEFALSKEGRAFPPTGLKRLVVKHKGRRNLRSAG